MCTLVHDPAAIYFGLNLKKLMSKTWIKKQNIENTLMYVLCYIVQCCNVNNLWRPTTIFYYTNTNVLRVFLLKNFSLMLNIWFNDFNIKLYILKSKGCVRAYLQCKACIQCIQIVAKSLKHFSNPWKNWIRIILTFNIYEKTIISF